MNSDMIIELTKAIRKLYSLEDSIIHEDRLDARDLRSKQALLVSEVIQSLQELESSVKHDTRHFAMPERQSSLIQA